MLIMFDGVNIIAVIGTTFFMMASATVWFSPMMFGKLWLRELKVTEEEIEASRQSMYTHLGLTAFSYAVALFVLAFIALRIGDLEITTLEGSVIIVALVVAFLGNISLWENKTLTYFLINSSFYTYFIIIGMFMLSYWPW